MTGKVIQTTVPGFVRDTKTHAIINNNRAEHDLYKARLNESLARKTLIGRIENLEKLAASLMARIEELEKRTE